MIIWRSINTIRKTPTVRMAERNERPGGGNGVPYAFSIHEGLHKVMATVCPQHLHSSSKINGLNWWNLCTMHQCQRKQLQMIKACWKKQNLTKNKLTWTSGKEVESMSARGWFFWGLETIGRIGEEYEKGSKSLLSTASLLSTKHSRTK